MSTSNASILFLYPYFQSNDLQDNSDSNNIYDNINTVQTIEQF